MKKLLIPLVLVFAIVAFTLYHHYVPDDAFIQFGYAKGIFNGKGYTFAGNRTYGATSPLWPPLIALASVLLRNIELSARSLSFVFAAAAILMMFRTARLRFNPFPSFVAAFLLAANSYFLRWSFTGMETTAACFLTILLAYVIYREKDGTIGRSPYFLLGFSPLIRPEFYAYLLILFVYLILRQRRNFDIVKIILAVIPVAGWLAFAKVYYGTIVSTTFIVKAGEPFFSTHIDTLVNYAKLFLSGNLTEIAAILISAAIFLVYRNRRSDKVKHLNPVNAGMIPGEVLLFTFFVASFYCFYALKNVALISRYTVMLSPLVILIAIDLVTRTARRVDWSERTKTLVFVSLMTASIFYNGTFTAVFEKPAMDRYYEGFQTQYMKIAGILANLNTGNCQVALTDVGIIGDLSGCRIDDMVGLVDRDRLNYKTKEAYLEAKRPEFAVLHGDLELDKIHASFQEIYNATVPAMGTSQSRQWHVRVYRIIWRKQ